MIRAFLLVIAIIAAIIAVIFFALYASNTVANAKDVGTGLIFLASSVGFFELGSLVPADARLP